MPKRTVMIAAGFALAACSGREPRGTTHASNDGGTYLVVTDDNAGNCGLVSIDGKHWPHGLDERAPISAGDHTLRCQDSEYSFNVAKGSVFKFNYWGP